MHEFDQLISYLEHLRQDNRIIAILDFGMQIKSELIPTSAFKI
jgi:hypothetical protein